MTLRFMIISAIAALYAGLATGTYIKLTIKGTRGYGKCSAFLIPFVIPLLWCSMVKSRLQDPKLSFFKKLRAPVIMGWYLVKLYPFIVTIWHDVFFERDERSILKSKPNQRTTVSFLSHKFLQTTAALFGKCDEAHAVAYYRMKL